METETLLGILVVFALLVIAEQAVLIYLAWKLLQREPVQPKVVTVPMENAAVARERKSESASGRLKQRSEGGSGRLRQKNESAPRTPGLRICPRCYSAINNEADECPACKNPLR